MAQVRKEAFSGLDRARTIRVVLVRSDEAKDLSSQGVVFLVVAADELGHALWYGLPRLLLLRLSLLAPHRF